MSSKLEPMIQLRLRGAGVTQDIAAVVDTGFNGALTIPVTVAAQMGLQTITMSSFRLADGVLHTFDSYALEIYWDGSRRFVVASAMGNDCLVGMRLLEGYEVRVEVGAGRSLGIVEL